MILILGCLVGWAPGPEQKTTWFIFDLPNNYSPQNLECCETGSSATTTPCGPTLSGLSDAYTHTPGDDLI